MREAGVFSIVLEKIPANLAGEISRSLDIPTIGIGAGVGMRRPNFGDPRYAGHVRKISSAFRAALRGTGPRNERGFRELQK